MSIIRGARAEDNYYRVRNSISGDKRLSWSARGLLIFLLSKPDHWEVSVAALVNETEGSLRGAGGHTKRDGVKAILAEVMAAGYIARSDKPKHNPDGSFAGYDYIVSDYPVEPTAVVSPSPDQPSTVEPSTLQPSPPNTTQVITDSKKQLSKSKNLSEDADASPVPAQTAAKKKEPAETTPVWEAYADAYTKRYSIPPLRNAKVNTALKNIVSQVGAERAGDLVRHYLTLDGFYEQRSHDIGVLVSDLQKVWNSLHNVAVSPPAFATRTGANPNRQEALEARNRAVAQEVIAEMFHGSH
ncbi:MAG: hypothetical protein JWP44_4370 [Mucilaginibacter sp.]|nr:hypothetical protein [Mucilaginibacter sp.]